MGDDVDYGRPLPDPWKTSFDLIVERLEEMGILVVPQHAPDTYRINGGPLLTRRQVFDFGIHKGTLFDPPPYTTIQPRTIPAHEILWNTMRKKIGTSA